MSTKEFIASLVASLAWPIVVLVLAIVLRTSLVDMLVRLRKIKHKDTEFEFEQQVMKIETAMPPQKTKTEPALPDALEKLITVSPRAAIMESWAMLESLIHKKALETSALEGTKRKAPFSRAIEAIYKVGAIDPVTTRAILEMRDLRNRVAHEDTEIKVDEARRYAVLASSLVGKLL